SQARKHETPAHHPEDAFFRALAPPPCEGTAAGSTKHAILRHRLRQQAVHHRPRKLHGRRSHRQGTRSRRRQTRARRSDRRPEATPRGRQIAVQRRHLPLRHPRAREAAGGRGGGVRGRGGDGAGYGGKGSLPEEAAGPDAGQDGREGQETRGGDGSQVL
ncbi:hypothetical protein DFJ74DRAFT_772203, partial [Hyaloraphidium curvatum]